VCSYVSYATDVTAAGYARGEWIDVRSAVVSFDHSPRLAPSHVVSIDFRAGGADPSARVAVELDAASARRLAATIVAALHAAEAEGTQL
jgi:hypothetical protein